VYAASTDFLLSNVKLKAGKGPRKTPWRGAGSLDPVCMRRGFYNFNFYKMVGAGGNKKVK
jgi:hypothetical protein